MPVFLKETIRLRSWALVSAQILIIAFLLADMPWVAYRADFQIWQLFGALLALGGILGLGWRSFSVFPEPKARGRLVQTGVYAYIRHPMYAGLLVFCGVLIWQNFNWLRLGLFLGLVGVLVLKIFIEENELEKKFPEYSDYKKSTNRLIPFLW